MISNATELRVAARQLRIMEDTLAALRDQMQTSNPKMFEVVSKAYIRRIALLQEQIAQYFANDPTAVSLILPRLEQLEVPAASTELSAV